MLTAPRSHRLGRGHHHIRLAEEFVYLAVDGRLLPESRRAGRAEPASLPLEPRKAIASRGGSLKDLIHHSDRGGNTPATTLAEPDRGATPA